MAITELNHVSGQIMWGKINSSIDVSIGDALYWNTSSAEWNLADADATPQTAYAWGFALHGIRQADPDATGQIAVARSVQLSDDDAPYTAGALQYLSDTAGAFTETAPSGAGDLVQVLGRAQSTSAVLMEAKLPTIQYEYVNYPTKVGSAGGEGTVMDDKSAYGVELQDSSANAIVHYATVVPDNCIGIVSAFVIHGGNEVLDASDDHKILSYSGVHDEPHDDATDTYTTTDWATTAADDVNRKTVLTAFNADDIDDPGSLLTWSIEKEEEGSGGEDPVIFGFVIGFEVV